MINISKERSGCCYTYEMVMNINYTCVYAAQW